MKLYEYIQALLDIQHLAGEDVEVVGSIWITTTNPPIARLEL